MTSGSRTASPRSCCCSPAAGAPRPHTTWRSRAWHARRARTGSDRRPPARTGARRAARSPFRAEKWGWGREQREEGREREQEGRGREEGWGQREASVTFTLLIRRHRFSISRESRRPSRGRGRRPARYVSASPCGSRRSHDGFEAVSRRFQGGFAAVLRRLHGIFPCVFDALTSSRSSRARASVAARSPPAPPVPRRIASTRSV